MFSVLRLTTSAARSILLQFEPKYGRPGDGKQAWLALQNKYQNNSRQGRRIFLRRLDNSVMKPDTDPDVFLSEIKKYAMNLVFWTKQSQLSARLTIILDALPAEMYSPVKLEAIQDPDLSLEQIQRMMRTIFINHSERVSVTKKNQDTKKIKSQRCQLFSSLVITAKTQVTK